MKKFVLAYIPVLHQGYLNFLRELYLLEDVPELILIDGGLLGAWAPTHKDIHALSIGEIERCVRAILPDFKIKIVMSGTKTDEDVAEIIFSNEKVFSTQTWEELEAVWEEGGDDFKQVKLFLPAEEAIRKLAEERAWEDKYEVEWRSVFLRWDEKKATAETIPRPDQFITETEFDQKIIKIAENEGQKSADWWRQVGAVLVKDGKLILTAHNLHLPHEQQPNVEGDIRGQFHKGVNWELGTAIHAEQDILACAAADGIAVAGTDLYVTDFPCPTCAKLIARAKIKNLYFQKGYALSDGERVLRAAGVKIIQVKINV